MSTLPSSHPTDPGYPSRAEPQFNHAMLTLADEATPNPLLPSENIKAFIAQRVEEARQRRFTAATG